METRKLATATLFGVAIAIVKAPFTFPITDYLIIVEVPILALSFLLLGRGGATYTGLVNGVLQSAVKVSFFPYDLIFAISYGALVDIFGTVLKVRTEEKANARRLALALGLASTVLGVSIAYVFLALNLSPGINLSSYSTTTLLEVVYGPIVVWGIISGTLGGYISDRVWEKNLKPRFKSIQA
ncbi:MAG: hypothetical protein OK452_01050 [Thaumarchaeota archaeon]|nr:hypothetical protein [Nitrososphaerota archaeon]